MRGHPGAAFGEHFGPYWSSVKIQQCANMPSVCVCRIYAFIELNFVFWRTRHEVTVTEWAPLWERTIDLLQIPENCYEEAVPKTLPPDGSTPPPSTKYPTQGTQVPVPTPPATSWPTRSATPPPTIATRMNEGQNCWNACKNDGRCVLGSITDDRDEDRCCTTSNQIKSTKKKVQR